MSELADEAHEALDVRPAQLLVRARQAGELAEVRVPAAAVPLGQDGEVVVVVGHDPLAEPLEREPRSEARQAVVALAERPHEPRVALRQPRRERALEADEERPPLRRAPELDEPVVGDPDERRGEHGHERLVVVAVVQQPQVGEQVDHLLLVVVVAAGRPERRQAELAERLLVEAGVRARCEEEDDLARSRLARVDELLDPGRDVLRLCRRASGRPCPCRSTCR